MYLVSDDLEDLPLPLFGDDFAVDPLVELPREGLGQLSAEMPRNAIPPLLDGVLLVQGNLDASFVWQPLG